MKQKIKAFDILDARVGIFNIRNLKHVDWMLAGLALALALIGLFLLYSADQSISSPVPYWLKQCVFLLLGIGIALMLMCVDSRFLVSIAPLFYIVAIVLLCAVIAFGSKAKGGQRWLDLKVIHLQPSEQTKLVVVLTLTWYLSLVKERIRNPLYLALAFVIAGVPAVLILKQPSLGTALAIGPITFVMVWMAGCRWWHMAVLIAVGVVAIPIVYTHGLKPYQRQRVDTFLHPKIEDVKTSGWQTRQSIITVGSGGLTGKGYLQGTQTMLNFLPEHHTDFIFSVLAEEQGLMGAVVVIGLFTAFLMRGLKIAMESADMPGALLASGIVTMYAFHIFINIAITVGLMPVTGIPLPFLSYGGNFYITTMIGIGLLLNVPVRKQLFD